MDGRGGRNYRALAMLLSLGFSIVLLAISPEIALAFGVGTLGYFAVFGKWNWQNVTAYVALLGAEAAIVFYADSLNVFTTLKAFAGGAYSFPIIQAGHILFFFFACGLVALFVAWRLHGVERGWNVNGSGGECWDFARSIGKMRYRSMSGLQQSES